MSRELVREFRSAPWKGKDDVARFVAAAREASPDALEAMASLLSDRRAVGEGRPHALRVAVLGRVLERRPERAVFGPLVKAVRAGDPTVLKAAADMLIRCNNVKDHIVLAELLNHDEVKVREVARTVLGAIGGPSALKYLTEQVGRSSFKGRIEAVDAMVGMAGPRALDGLRNALGPASSTEKLRILSYLTKLDLPDAAKNSLGEALIPLVNDSNSRVVVAAIGALGRMLDEDTYLELTERFRTRGDPTQQRAAIQALANHRTPRSLSILKGMMSRGSRATRLIVIETLEQLGTEDVLPILAEALEHPQLEVRHMAAESIKRLGASGSIDIERTTLWLLRSDDVEVKRMAADIARSVQDTHGAFWPQLLEFLKDEDWWVRERISDALIELGGDELTRHMYGYLTDESDVVRRYGVEMLMRINDPQSLGALVKAATEDPDWWVRERALEAIGDLGDKRAVPYVVDLMQREPEMVYACLYTLERLKDASAAPAVAQWLFVDDPELQLEALNCLDSIDNGSSAGTVAQMLQHPDHRIRTKAHSMLSQWHVEQQYAADYKASDNLIGLDRLLVMMAESGGDDLLLGPGRPPYIKKLGEAVPLIDKSLTEEQVVALLYPKLNEIQRNRLAKLQDIDFSYEVEAEGLRFRVNVLQTHQGLAAVFRIVRNEIPDMMTLGLPAVVETFGDLSHGLVLIGGPTGSGKSTTLAALIDYINRNYRKHIITIEDPIEVRHEPKLSLINQRELGSHSASFSAALKSTLREDPDVILVGEMRDLETISFAITAAETGHLVFGTVHTASADTTVDRLINAFPSSQQPQVRSILSNSLRAVCCQYLAPRIDRPGRVPAVEVMINNEAIANMIRKGKAYQLNNVISLARDMGMQTMDQELTRLYKSGTISADTAYLRAANKREMSEVIAQIEGVDMMQKTGEEVGLSALEES